MTSKDTPPTGLGREALVDIIRSYMEGALRAGYEFDHDRHIGECAAAILAAMPGEVDDDALKLEIAGLNTENCNLRDERQAMLKEINGLKDTRTELANEVLRLRNVVYDTGFRDGKPKESDLLTKARAVVAADDRLEREADGSRLCRDERQRFVLFNAIDALREVVEEKNETTNNPLPEKGNP